MTGHSGHTVRRIRCAPMAPSVPRRATLPSLLALVAVVGVLGAASAQAASPAEAPSPRGFDPEYLLATYYDDSHLNPASELLTRPESTPIDFYLACWGEEWPFEGCKLIDELSDGAYYSVRWQSRLLVPATGDYTFDLANVDDGARLYIDGAPIIDKGWNWPDPDVHASPQTIHLEAGWHPITIDYEQRPAYVASLQVRWSGPDFADEVIPMAPEGLAGIDLRSVRYLRRKGASPPVPGSRLRLLVSYRKPDAGPPLEVVAVRFTIRKGTESYMFSAAPGSRSRVVTWRVPEHATGGVYTLNAALEWRATDGSGLSGIDTQFDGIGFPGPGAKQFTLYQVKLAFQTMKMRDAGVSPKVLDPLDPPQDVRIGVVLNDRIAFHALVSPALELDRRNCRWRLRRRRRAVLAGGQQFTATFNRSTGDYTLSLNCLGVEREARISVAEVPEPNELDWIKRPRNWLAVPSVFALARHAQEWSREMEDQLGGGHGNGRTDAARHAYWNALMVITFDGTRIAREAATAHERTNLEDNAPHNAIVMDLTNNAAGRAIGRRLLPDVRGLTPNQQLAAAENAVIQALNAGGLTILDDLDNEHERGLLKPSDQ